MKSLIGSIAEIAREAGSLMLHYGKNTTYVKEGHFNFVTQADIDVQNLLNERLSALLPEASFFAEEKENAELGPELTWVVDPIDGTINYMRGRSVSAVSIALMQDRKPIIGVIYDPYHDEVFCAEKGKGTTCNGQSVHVSDTPFEKALVSFGTAPYNAVLARRSMDIAYDFLRDCGDLRRCGSAALDMCDIACGRADIFFELQLSPWDFSAASLIVTEAGGFFAMPDRDEPEYGGKAQILACNPGCAERALAEIREQA